MTHPETLAASERPKGVYFFAQDPRVKQFLDREGNPSEILDELVEYTVDEMTRLCHFLKTSILQCRGVEKIDEEVNLDDVIVETNKRMEFYLAADTKLGQLAVKDEVRVA